MSTKLGALTILLLFYCQEAGLSALTNATSLPMASDSFYKTSFDCAKAKDYSVEQAICKNDELARLDVEMADSYKKRLKSVTASQKSEVIRSQQKWLMIRNSYDVNPYHGDPVGTLSDLSDFYRNRIVVLGSAQMTSLKAKPPPEYDWVKAIEPEGFSKEFSLGRGHMSCDDPCEEKPSLYKLLSIGGSGIGQPPGDVDTPYAKIVHKLTSGGWTKCRSADDSGTRTIDYFEKNDKMIAISRAYSMGVGNGIGLSIATSSRLSENPSKTPPNSAVAITPDWAIYSSPDVGLQLRYPPDWWVRDDNLPNGGTKFLTFGAKDSTGNFTISIQPEETLNRQPTSDGAEEDQKCSASPYRVSGFPSRVCLYEGENVVEGTCTRYLQSIDIKTGRYYLRFEPISSGSFVDDSNQYKLTDLYQKILSTIEIK
jgi:uncharacterized protein YecT (DUF1311 family)